jgi:maleylacetoacetate isomerase
MKLHSFSHSSASYRVRIVMALKGLTWETIPVSLREDAHLSASFLAINPQGRVPALQTEHGILTQSLAMIDWLEETHPSPSIYPQDPWQRALCRAFAHVITTDIFPLQNLSTRRKLGTDFGCDEAGQAAWCRHWIGVGFAALEEELGARKTTSTAYLFADAPTLAEVCLVPQMNNARRYGLDLNPYPRLVEADAKARTYPAFISTAPDA